MKIMVIAAHPQLDRSRANQALLGELKEDAGIFIRDLYREYPDWNIDVEKEHRLLLEHDRIVLQFPFYWYSCPPLLKKWFDDVLTFGWAYGPGGDRLLGKEFLVGTTAGGPDRSYRAGGDNRFTVDELLRPIERTLTRCNGTYLPAFVVYDANQSADAELAREARRYAEHIWTPQSALAH